MKTKKKIPITERCAICGGSLRQATQRLEEWHGDILYVFENVPVQACAECGEIWIEGSVAEKMDELIATIRPVRTTDSDHRLAIHPNLLPELVVSGLDQLWLADITYIRLPREFVSLAALLDAFSSRCIGWALERYLVPN